MANCPICQSGAKAEPLCKVNLGFAADYDLVECPGCGVRRLDPLPGVEELSQFYASKDYGQDWYKQQGLGMAFAKSLLRYKAAGRFLDVGCGQGFFLDGIRKHSGWQVQGTEFTPALADFAARELGLDVRHGELSDVSFPGAHFDYIHISNVLEHVREPVGLLRECRRIIKPDGVLHLRVPNGSVDSLNLIKYFRSERRPALSPSGHLFFFPRRTLLRMFEESGFEVASSRTYGIRRGLRSLGLYPQKRNWKKSYLAGEPPRGRQNGGPVLTARKNRPDVYYRYRFLQFRLKMLPGMRGFGLDYLLLLRPKVSD